MRRRKRIIACFALTFGFSILMSFLLPASTLVVVSTAVFTAAFFAIFKIII